jgi:hypothetical protein
LNDSVDLASFTSSENPPSEEEINICFNSLIQYLTTAVYGDSFSYNAPQDK